ncbi:MAG: acetate kinase [Desulfosarcina sp.]
MKILVFNSGSSSIKYKLIDMRGEALLADGLVERIGEPAGMITHRVHTQGAPTCHTHLEQTIGDHVRGMEIVVALLTTGDTGVIDNPEAIGAIGHRVVHGGDRFRESTLIDDTVTAGIEACIPLAPLHNPGSLTVIRTAMALFPATRQVAVFDTAYHRSIPPCAYHYALPYRLYEELGIRRYGFHGTSQGYVAREAARFLGKPVKQMNMICLHLGNGASITAIANGRSVDTSMGMTPLAGVIMGSRCGDIDPSIIALIAEKKKLPMATVMDILSTQSGLKGICGSNDLRDIHRRCEAGDERARLALEMLIYRYKHYVGAYLAILGRVDAIVFTAGIGENDAVVRQGVCEGLEGLGIIIDADRNANWDGMAGSVGASDSRVKVLVMATNEELEIARQTAAIVSQAT